MTKVSYVDSDILIIGGGMAGTGAAWEARYWGRNLKIVLVEKANIDRSGAVAMGLSAINTYLGLKYNENTIEDYVNYVKTDLMGVVREDLVYDYARHVDSTVYLFDEWGLPIFKDENGRYVREGRWQIMIHGESYKPIVAEAAKKSVSEIYNRVMITHLLKDSQNPNRVAGAIGFNVRDGRVYVFRSKAVIVSAGGGSQIYRPRSTSEGKGRTWYPHWSSGSSYGMLIEAGAVMTMMEARFSVPRYKDGYGPVGAWQLMLKAKQTNAYGQDPFSLHKEELKKLYDGKFKYVDAFPTPTNLRVYSSLLELKQGRGPIYLHTEQVLTEKNEELGWEDFLDMTITQAILWAGQNIDPIKTPSEVLPSEPYVMGSHATECGAWASGPEDMVIKEAKSVDERGTSYNWGYNRMSTLDGLFLAGDACGASPHKFSSGSFTEGRIAAKSAVRYIKEHSDENVSPDSSQVEQLTVKIFEPIERYNRNKRMITGGKVSSNMMWYEQGMARLQKLMDEYAGGWGSWYTTNEHMLLRAQELLTYLKEDFLNYAVAEDYHQLLRTWELWHRILTAEAVVNHMLFRKETRWPGYYVRSDFPALDDDNWRVFVNSKYDAKTGAWKLWSVPVVELR
ncbi:MAG: adenylyl-sulfate reductase subunit alpha [Conexivisphaerales archaeon]|nr:adenylyl-sulfate reductase subunit alpha [Conexivisphaerales archaeon]